MTGIMACAMKGRTNPCCIRRGVSGFGRLSDCCQTRQKGPYMVRCHGGVSSASRRAPAGTAVHGCEFWESKPPVTRPVSRYATPNTVCSRTPCTRRLRFTPSSEAWCPSLRLATTFDGCRGWCGGCSPSPVPCLRTSMAWPIPLDPDWWGRCLSARRLAGASPTHGTCRRSESITWKATSLPRCSSRNPPPFRSSRLLVSGGHTQLVEVGGVGDYRVLGESVDDAAGGGVRQGRDPARASVPRRPCTGGACPRRRPGPLSVSSAHDRSAGPRFQLQRAEDVRAQHADARSP